MTNLYAPTDKGFDARLEAIDRCQVGLLRELASQQGGRLILKGGMAMRGAFGSMRLTKDIDFDREQTLSQEALKRGLRTQLIRAAATAGIKTPKVEFTNDTQTTVRARLAGTIAGGAEVRFDVEVSGRSTPHQTWVRTQIVNPPPRYGMAPFLVKTYTNEALAAMKIAAALSEQRNAPRDLYDLRDLIRAGANPTNLLAQQDADLLEDYARRAPAKLEMLSYALAQQELLPYLPVDERSLLTEHAWIEATLMVADHVVRWCGDALELQRQHVAAGAQPDGDSPGPASTPRRSGA